MCSCFVAMRVWCSTTSPCVHPNETLQMIFNLVQHNSRQASTSAIIASKTLILLRRPLPRARTLILHLRVDDLLQITEAWVDGVLVFSFCFDFVKLATCDETV
ncbi:hypothetical protein VPH35_072441 [Triticum aestivum]